MMKKSANILIVTFIALTYFSCNNSNYNKSELKNEVDSISYYSGIHVGLTLKELDITRFNNNVFNKAIQNALSNKKLKISKEDAEYNIGLYLEKYRAQQNAKNLEKGQAFLAKTKTKVGVFSNKSGLLYEIIRQGNGLKPKPNDFAVINYKGSTIDGREFLNSYNHGQSDTIQINEDYTLKGWAEALKLMNVGSKYKIYLPTELCYDSGIMPGNIVKPYMALIFEIELLAVVPNKEKK